MVFSHPHLTETASQFFPVTIWCVFCNFFRWVGNSPPPPCPCLIIAHMERFFMWWRNIVSVSQGQGWKEWHHGQNHKSQVQKVMVMTRKSGTEVAWPVDRDTFSGWHSSPEVLESPGNEFGREPDIGLIFEYFLACQISFPNFQFKFWWWKQRTMKRGESWAQELQVWFHFHTWEFNV